MIFGIGIDIVQVNRIEKNNENQNFLNKIYTEEEQDYLKKRNFNPQTAAGLFAAKEAVSKALGTGISGFNITDIEIINDEFGKPEIFLHNKALEISRDKGIDKINISISHEKDYAIAFAVAEKFFDILKWFIYYK